MWKDRRIEVYFSYIYIYDTPKENIIKKGAEKNAIPREIYRDYATPNLYKKIKKQEKTHQPQNYSLANKARWLATKDLEITATLSQEQKEKTKALLSLLKEISSLSNNTLFLSFQIAQNKLKEAALWGFLSTFLTGILFQLVIQSLTSKESTQAIPMAANKEAKKTRYSKPWDNVSANAQCFLLPSHIEGTYL